MKKEAKVHMLPTEDKTAIRYNSSLKIISKDISDYGVDNNDYISCQHLYITTSQEIKEGDCYIHPDATVPQNDFNHVYVDCRKIIATTDPKLLKPQIKQVNWIGSERIMNLPQIQQSFIEEYCKQGGIDKVLVEYTEIEMCFNYNGSHYGKDCSCKGGDFRKVPKTDSNNYIIIHPVEEKTYSRKEVEVLCRNAHLLGMKETLPGYPKPETIDEWIKENL